MEGQAHNTPTFVVAGRFLTGLEEERWQRVLRNPVGGVLQGITVVVLAFFSLQAATLAAQSDWQVPTLVFPMIAACGWFLLSWFFRVRKNRQMARENTWLDKWQDEKCMRAGCMISFYEDHAAYSTMRGSTLLPYAAVTVCCETADGIAFGNARYMLYLRAADLTANELNGLRRFLQQHITSSVYRTKTMAVAGLAEPLPHVRFANFDSVMARALCPKQDRKRQRQEILGFVIPQLMIYSVIPALMTRLTPWPLVNVLIYCASFVLIGLLLTRVFMVWLIPAEAPIQLAFTKEGIARRQDGVETFTVRGRYRLLKDASGVTIMFSSGEQLRVPWDAMDNPDAVKFDTV